MKMSKSFIAALGCVALLATAPTPASAQFGLGKLKEKVKKEVKKEVRSKVREKEREAKNAVESKARSVVKGTSNDGSGADFNPYKKFTPSAECKASDRYATDATVKPGFTKSVGQIHATYEHLDAIYNAADGVHAPYQPYYTDNNRAFYFTGTGVDDVINETFGKMLMKAIAADASNIYWITDYINIDPDNPALVVPKDEMFMNALACQYIADPKSIFAFELWLKADMYKNEFSMQCKLGLQDEARGVVDGEHMLPGKYRQWCQQREWAAQNMAAEYIPYAELVKLANKYNKLMKDASDPTQKLMHFLVLRRLVSSYMPSANGFSKSDDAYRLMSTVVESTNAGELYMNAAGAHAEPVAEPKGVAVNASIKKLANSVVGKFVAAGAKVEKIIYLDSKWHTLKSPKWPYDVIAYSLPCAVVTVENGKRYVQQAVLTKDAKSSDAFMQAGTDSMKRPLKK